MRFLGLRLDDHDSNFCFLKDNKIYYKNLARFHDRKYFAYDNLLDWRNDFEEIFQEKVDDLDAVCIVCNSWKYGEKIDTDILYEQTSLLGLKCPVWRIDHHYAHMLSNKMFIDSDIDFVFDGAGDFDFRKKLKVSWTVFKDDKILKRGYFKEWGESIGTLYESIGIYCDMKCHHGLEFSGKLMSLQSYGDMDLSFLNKLSDISFEDEETYKMSLNYLQDLWIKHNSNDFLVSELKKINFARTMNHWLGDKILNFIQKFAKEKDKITLSGGIGLNIIWNSLIKKKFPNYTVLPHTADDGLAIGCLQFLKKMYNVNDGVVLNNYPYCEYDESPNNEPDNNLLKDVSNLLSKNKIIAWYQGNGEVGPRALGNRSILMNPKIVNGKDKINSVKNREYFRPFGCSILDEKYEEYFDHEVKNPYMLYQSKIDNKYIDEFKSILHIDNTSRPQSVSDNNSNYYRLLKFFYEDTGIPLLLNTSLNVSGKPICFNIKTAINYFQNNKIDALVVGGKIYLK